MRSTGRTLCCLLLWSLALPGLADTNPLTQLSARTLRGGIVSAASCVSDNASDPNGAVLSLSGIPAGATIVEAWLWYVVLNNGLPIPTGNPTLNGTPLTPVPLGSLPRTPCFPQSHTGSFRADVSAIVTADGDYTLAGMPGGGGPQSGTFVEGATLLVVYCDAGSPVTDVVIYDGVDVVSPGFVHSQVMDGFTASADPVTATWLAVCGNGQDTGGADPDPLTFNGTQLETFVPTLQVLGGQACDNPANLGWWDRGLYDVSSLVAAGSSTASAALDVIADCYSVAAYVLAVSSEGQPECPESCSIQVQAAPDAELCEGEQLGLDAQAEAFNCAGGVEYRWLEDGNPISGWGPDPQLPVVPAADATYTIEARCVDDPDACFASDDVVVTVHLYPAADAGAQGSLCVGEQERLDGSGSSHPDCPGGLEYRWLDNGNPIGPWSSTPDVLVSPTDASQYVLEVRCADAPQCVSSDTVDVVVYRPPSANAGPDTIECIDDPFTLAGQGAGSVPCTQLEYRWLLGAVVVRDWSSNPDYDIVVSADATYTLEVRCADEAGCVATDSMFLEAIDCTLAVDFGAASARRVADGVEINWSTLSEQDSYGFELWARDASGGEWRLPGLVNARGSGSSYRVLDDSEEARSGVAVAYRVVEIALSGDGDATPWLSVEQPASGGGRRGRDGLRRR